MGTFWTLLGGSMPKFTVVGRKTLIWRGNKDRRQTDRHQTSTYIGESVTFLLLKLEKFYKEINCREMSPISPSAGVSPLKILGVALRGPKVRKRAKSTPGCSVFECGGSDGRNFDKRQEIRRLVMQIHVVEKFIDSASPPTPPPIRTLKLPFGGDLWWIFRFPCGRCWSMELRGRYFGGKSSWGPRFTIFGLRYHLFFFDTGASMRFV